MEPSVKKEPLDGGEFKINVSAHHTFGTDAVLLSNFAQAKRKDKEEPSEQTRFLSPKTPRQSKIFHRSPQKKNI